MVVYSTTVTAVGELVSDFRNQGILVFFGEGAPEELHDFSVLHKVEISHRAPIVGDLIRINNEEFNVLAVGSVVSDNLLNLGHLDLKANGLNEAELPGDTNIEARPMPIINVGDKFEIIARN